MSSKEAICQMLLPGVGHQRSDRHPAVLALPLHGYSTIAAKVDQLGQPSKALQHTSAQHPSALRVQPQTQACLADTGATKGVARISAGLPRRTWLGSARNVSPRGVRAERRGPN